MARVLEATRGKGARLVFDPVGGPMVERLAAVTEEHGTLFLYGALSRDPTPLPLFTVLGKHLAIRGYTLFELTSVQELREAAVCYVADKLGRGAFRPRIAKVFPLEQIVEAQRYMESNEQIGKIVVTVH